MKTTVLLTFAALVVGVFGAEKNLLGVDPAEKAKYTRADGKFECDGGSKVLDLSAVNDGYCDCVDGTDEPGTGACANAMFYCANEPFKAKKIPASRVNDGVCDCCDGSDEYMARPVNSPVSVKRGAFCKNTCVEDKKKHDAETAEKRKMIEKGLEERKKLVEIAAGKIKDKQEEIEKKRVEMSEANVTVPELEADWKEKKKKFEAIEEVWKKGKEEFEKAQEEKKKAREEEKKKAEEEKKNAEGEKVEVVPDQPNKENDLEPPVVNKVVEDGRNELGPTEEEGEEEEEEDEELTLEDMDDEEAEAKEKEEEEKYEETEELKKSREEKNSARQKYDDQNGKVNRAKSDIEKMEKELGKDYGEDKCFYALYDECITLQKNQYKYEMCFFQKSKQESTSLGTFEHWEGDNHKVMKYTKGQRCWNGPDRTVTAILECGAETKLLDASEPAMCEYEYRVSTPCACSEAELAAL